MADIGSAVRAVLAGDANVSATVSTRIYPDRLPQNVTYPAITYENNGGYSHEHMTGISGLAETYITVYCWAKTRIEATALAEYVRLALTQYKGTSASVVVCRIHSGVEATDVDEPEDDSDLPTYWHEREYHCFFNEATL